MLILYYLFLKSPLLLLIPYLLQVIPYYFILKKLGINKYFSIIPSFAEYHLSNKVFPRKRTFYRAFILSIILVSFAFYVSPYHGLGIAFLTIAFIVYSVFLFRLYRRMSKAFAKKWYFTLGLVTLTPLFLLILGLDKSQFTQPEFKPTKTYGKYVTIFRKICFVLISITEVIVIVLLAGFFSIKERLPRILVDYLLEDVYTSTSEVIAEDSIVTREDVLQGRLNTVLETNKGRDKFFPSHKNDKDVTVFVYIIGSNLEDASGLASANITQMIDATKEGTGLKFVIEAGGAERWFTRNIKNNSYGRYEIYDGKLTQVVELSPKTNMASEKELTDFLVWSKENYNSDRNMLVLWDHGGGLSMGYGQDHINGSDTIPVSDIIDALETAQVKYDIIGFDACLMQDIEIANAMEPYADYYIASEETEGGYGWTYTYAFSSLAKDPGMSSTEFGKQLIACYDPYNTIINNGEIDTNATLSFVDLPAVSIAYNKLNNLFDSIAELMVNDPKIFADVSIAADNSYCFSDSQIDLIGFLEILDELDYSEAIFNRDEMNNLMDALNASILYRNANSAYGVNGMAFSFGNQAMRSYNLTNAQLKALENDQERNAFDIYYSIIAAQNAKNSATQSASMDDGLTNYILDLLLDNTYTKFDWYIEGFEDYDNTEVFIDIPLIETENGYQADLPEKTWSIISDVQTMVYQYVDDVEGAYTRYLGNDYLGDLDENGNYLISADENWVHINGQIVCYEADKLKITKAGEVYTGKIKARLNNTKDIYVLIEWDPVEDDAPEKAHVIGYISDSELNLLEEKGTQDFKAGDSIQFLFSYYDQEGNYIDTLPEGKRIIVSKQERIEVVDQKMEPCKIEFGGVLKDVYQRLMTTEMIEYTITD